MKHNHKVTAIILLMFLLTQFIGLYVVNHYLPEDVDVPFGIEAPPIEKESDYRDFLIGIVFAFIFAILIFFLLTKFKLALIIKTWFFLVIIIALGIFFNAVLPVKNAEIIALIISIPLAFFKIFEKNLIIHNLTELMVYPGIAAVFVPILNVWTIFALLLLISVYDMWAVWRSGIMQKMAKYQISTLNLFSGFYIPYLSKKQSDELKKSRSKLKSDMKKGKSIKVNVAILGGGDVIFPIITAGVVLAKVGLIPALLVIAGATLGLGFLFYISEKKKFYPAMPFITAGIVLGYLVSLLI
jgi:presenilin-like A22 family membrane protease